MSRLKSYAELAAITKGCRGAGGRILALIPVGCTEQHGPYLPVQTDTLIATALCDALVDTLPQRYLGYAFPAIPYTPTKSNSGFVGTISIEEDTFRRYTKDVVTGILGSEFDAAVLISTHGPADPSVVEVAFNLVHAQYRSAHEPVKPVLPLTIQSCRPLLAREFAQESGKHADWIEFVHLLHILGPSYFDEDRLANICRFAAHSQFHATNAIPGVPMELRVNHGVLGCPIPNSEDWNSAAEKAWNLTVSHLMDQLCSRLDEFWNQ